MTDNTWTEADVVHLVSDLNNTMDWAPRIHWQDFTPEKYMEVVIQQTSPLVVEGAMDLWSEGEKAIFTLNWLQQNHGNQEMQPRNVDTLENLEGWTLNKYITFMEDPQRREATNLYGKVGVL